MSNKKIQQQISITEENTTEVICKNCNTGLFEQCIMLRKMSAFISPNGEEQLIQIPVMVCKNCGTPLIGDE
jgi:RNase P subunit RPR2